MKLIRAADITQDMVTTSAVETASLWSSGTTYNASDTVYKGIRLYESVAGSNLNHDPESTTGYWLDIGPINPMAMFDNVISTTTTDTDVLEVTIDFTGRVDSIYLGNVSAATVNIVIMDGVTEVYNETVTMSSTSAIEDWYGYFFEDIVREEEVLFLDLPNVLDPSITLTFTDTGATVYCGHLVAGTILEVGGTVYGASYGITDYSRKEQDQFGNWSITPRGFSKRGSFRVFIENDNITNVFQTLSQYRATPVMVIGSSIYSPTFIFGLLKDWSIEISYPSHSIATIEMEGLT